MAYLDTLYLSDTAICTRCGTDLLIDEATFCPMCGEVRVPGRICDKANDSCPMGSRKGVDIVELANGPDPPGHARFYPRVGDRA